jgi:parallel beta-helix repeat protein
VQHVFRLSQKFKPETSVSIYAPVLRAALDHYLDLPRVPSVSSFGGQVEQRLADGSLANSNEAFLQFIVELLGPSTNGWEELNARRLELEALRPDRRLSTVHEEAVKLLRGDVRVRNLQSEVLLKTVEGDWASSAQKEKDTDYWSGIVARVESKLRAALKAVMRDHHELFLLLELSPQILLWAGLSDIQRRGNPPLHDQNLVGMMGDQARRTYIVSPATGGDFERLTDAIVHAEPGSRLIVRPGMYEGSIELEKPLQIVGDGPVGEIIISATDAATISVLAPGVVMRGLTIRWHGSGEGRPALNLYREDTAIDDCIITSTGPDAVRIMGALANPMLRGCVIRDCPGVGVRVQLRGRGLIEDCDIAHNGSAGVAIVAEANPVLRNNQIRDGLGIGVVIARAARGTLDNNEITGNAGAGLEIVLESEPGIRNCRISQNGDVAVRVDEGSAGSIADCDLIDNAGGPWDIASGSKIRRRDNRAGHTL